MKNFSFNINNFYSIFEQMPDDKKNIDSILEREMRKSLYNNTSPEFSFELMKRVELQKEFAREDIKTDKMVKFILGGVIFLLIGFTFLFTYIFSRSESGNKSSYFMVLIDRFTTFIENISATIAQNLGFAFTSQTGLIILLVMICVFIFSFAEKIIVKKGFK